MSTSSHTIRNWLFSLIGIGLLALLLILVNYVAGELRLRADLTEHKIYTLSESSRQVIDQITTPVAIRLYYSRSADELPTMVKAYAQRIDDLLREYRELANGRLIVDRIDPKPDSETEDDAMRAGLTPFPLPNGDSFFLGMVIRCLDVEVVLPALMPMGSNSLEYDLTRAIYRVIHPVKPTLGLMSGIKITGEQGNPMLGMQGGRPPWQFLTMLKEMYDVQEIPLNLGEIPEHIDRLLVVHPKEISLEGQFALDQFVLRGGRLVALVDSFCMADVEENAQMPWMRPQPGNSSLPMLFSAWGIDFPLGQALFDLEHPLIFANQMGQEQTLVGYVHLDERANNDDEVVVRRLDNILMPLPGGFRLTEVEGITKTVLLQSSEQAALLNPISPMGQNLMHSPYSAIVTKVQEAGVGERIPLAIKLEGSFKTAFPEGHPTGAGAALKESTTANTIFLIADVDFLYDELWFNQVGMMGQRVPTVVRDNFFLIQNALDALGGTLDMIALRSRSSLHRPLEKIVEMKRLAAEKQQSKIQEVMDELEALQQSIRDIRVVQRGHQLVIELSEEQMAKLDEYEAQREQKRKELRQLRREEREEVVALQNWWIRFNIVLVPFLIAHFGIILALFRMRRKTSQMTRTEG